MLTEQRVPKDPCFRFTETLQQPTEPETNEQEDY